MSAPWYSPSGTPATNAQGSSSDMRSEFSLVETAMDKLPTLTANGVVVVNAGGTALIPITSGLALTSPVLTTPQIQDTSADHQYIVAVSELTADRTITLPLLTGNDTFVFAAFAQTLSNKTLTLPQINDTSSDHQYIFAVKELVADRTVTLPLLTGNDEFVFKDHAVTLTNKTLTFPVIATISNAGTVTIPTGTDRLVARTSTDTLTNKTLTSPVLNTQVTGTAVLDEDAMGSDSNTKLATQQSIKAYVDNNVSLSLDSATPKTSTFNAVAGKYYYVDTNGGAFTMNFPATPSVDDLVGVMDYAGTFNTNNLTLGRNGSKVMRATANGTIDSRNWTTAWEYTGATHGWLPRGF